MQILKEKIVRYETDGTIVKGYDAGELIRCKDCKWWKAEKEECVEWYDEWYGSPYAPADGYCFRAERKEK